MKIETNIIIEKYISKPFELIFDFVDFNKNMPDILKSSRASFIKINDAEERSRGSFISIEKKLPRFYEGQIFETRFKMPDSIDIENDIIANLDMKQNDFEFRRNLTRSFRSEPTSYNLNAYQNLIDKFNNDIKEIVVVNVGQANLQLIKVGSNTKLIYDFGSPLGDSQRHRRETLETVLDEIANPELGIISHWDFDHYSLLTESTDEELNRLPSFICRPVTAGLTAKKVYDKLSSINKVIELSYISDRRYKDRWAKHILNSSCNITNTYEHYSRNKNSIGLSIHTPDKLCLLTGDAHYNQVNHYLVSNNFSYIDFAIVIPHHGGPTGNEAFGLNIPETVSKRGAFISCGLNNKYGHPISQVLARLFQDNFVVERTDQIANDSHILF